MLIGGFYMISLFDHPDGERHHNSLLGAIFGLILIGFYQQKFKNDWVYRARLFLNAVALGLGFLLWALPDLIIQGFDPRSLRVLLLESAMGFIFGLFIGLFQHFQVWLQSRKIPYTGSVTPIIAGNAQVIYSANRSSDYGRAILLPDRLLFLSLKSAPREILLKDIHSLEIGKTVGFPNRLIILSDEAESMALSVAMPCYWKNKIDKRSRDSNLKF